MKHIKQKHRNGCGIACIAMLTGNSYQKVLSVIFPDREKGSVVRGTNVFHDLRAFEELNVKCQFSFKKGKLTSFKKDIMIVVRTPSGIIDHAVMWDHKKQQIVDPGHQADAIYDIDEKYCRKHQKYRITLA